MKSEKACQIEVNEVVIAYCKARVGELSVLGQQTGRKEFFYEAHHWIDMMKQKYTELEQIREPKILRRAYR